MNQLKPGVTVGGGPFVRGAPLTPASELLAWLASQTQDGRPRRTRLPIALLRGQVGFSLRGARVGDAPDALEVALDDSALGIGLADRALACKGERCWFIVEGFWRGDAEGPDGHRFEVRYASQRPASAEEVAAFSHADVEVAR